MIPDWLLGLMAGVILAVGGGAVWHFWGEKPQHALWSCFCGCVLLGLVGALYIRNDILMKELAKAVTPELLIRLNVEDDPAVSPYNHPLYEYTLFVSIDNMKRVPIQDLSVEFFFPNIISQVRGSTST